MTLLVGVLCSNGAVLAADRQATHGAMGQQTVGQSVTKVQVIRGEALYATSGHKGLGQQLCAIVEGKQQEFKNQGYARNIVKLQEALRPIIDAGFQTAKNAAGVYWTIQHAIDMKVTGVGFSVDVFVVVPSDKTYKAWKLEDAEVAEHADFIKASEEALRSVREALTKSPATQGPPETPPTLNQKT